LEVQRKNLEIIFPQFQSNGAKMINLQAAELNFNYVVVNFFIASLSAFSVAFISLWLARKKKIIPLYLFGSTFLFMGLGSLFESLGDLYLSIPIRNLSAICYVILYFIFTLFFNYTRKESWISIHLSIWAALSTLFLFLEFQPANHHINSSATLTTLARNELLNNVMMLTVAFYVLLLFTWVILTIVKSPSSLKKTSLMLLIPIPAAVIEFFIFSKLLPIHEPSAWILFTVNCIFLVFLIYQPQLLYVLPFKLHRLTVIEAESGVSLFQYEWSSEKIDESILSGLISAIQNMGEEILKRGGIRRIDWELGLLFFATGKYTIVTLLSSKASKSLRSSLSSFTEAFENKFQEQLESDYRELSQYTAANELITEYFANIPKHKTEI
jgi:hypothetical protein